jgi:hypothetical protein
MPESLQQLLVTNFGLSPSGYTGSEGTVGYVGSSGTNGYTGSAGASGSGILISNIQVTDSSYIVLDDTAVDVAGGYIKITGSGFVSGCSVLINQTAATSVTFISSTEVRAQVPATTAGTYIVYLVNTNGDVAIRVNGVTFSATPTWVTGSSLSGVANTAISIQLSASSAAAYALQAGSSLPAGVTLSNVGLISGTVSGLSSNTVYNFTIVATDAELQDSPRSFALTITAGDPYFNYTTLLLSGNGSMSGNTAVKPFTADASTNNFAITVNGDTRTDAFNPYQAGYYSNYFDGTGDYLSLASSTAFDLAAGDFTIEFWMNTNASQNNNARAIGNWNNDGWTANKWSVHIKHDTSTRLTFWVNNANPSAAWLTSSTVVNGIGWAHVAIVKSGTAWSMFINGTREATATSSTAMSSGACPIQIGGTSAAGEVVTGYISNIRMVKGTAVYSPSSTTITVPTAPLTAVANTQLLTCQSNRLIDTSTNAFAVTRNGDTVVSVLQPFVLPNNLTTYGSAYFDGTGDVLTPPANNVFAFGTDSFCIEAWIFNNVLKNYSCLVTTRPNNSNYGDAYHIGWDSVGGVSLYVNSTPTTGAPSGTITTGQWQHFVCCRDSSNRTAIFVNGTRVGNDTVTSNFSRNLLGIGDFPTTPAEGINGYISNLRLVKGNSVYDPTQTTITVPTSPLTAISNTALLTAQYNGATTNNVFKDSSGNNLATTRNGNLPQGTFSPYGNNWSNYFNGTSQLSFASNAGYAFGTSDFTVECWYFATSNPGYRSLIETRASNGTNNGWALAADSGGAMYVYANGFILSGITVVLNTWNHVAFTRSGSTQYLFLNGALVSSTTTARTYSDTNLGIGGVAYTTGEYWTGYLSNVRLIKGTCLYTTTFTPLTTPLTAVSGATMLTCQSNRFIDNSTTNATITAGSNMTVQRFSPFSPSAAYSASTVGGSGYFDGTGDYLSIPTSAPLVLSGSVWTMECWVYPTFALSTSPYQVVICKRVGASAASYDFYFNLNSGYLSFYNGTGYNSSALPIIGAWNHIAAVYDGTNINLFMNGVRVLQTATANPDNGGNLYIGADENGTSNFFTGYISNVRILKGTALYSGTTYTVPTEPVTAVANTSLLINFTNAGVIDNTMMNNIETVGDAKLSTAVSKFGGASMLFDGTGDRLDIPSNQLFNFGTANFTVEFWIYPSSWTTNAWNTVFAVGQGTNNGGLLIGKSDVNTFVIRQYGIASIVSTSTLPTVGVWTHVACVRNSGTSTLYYNGVSIASASDSTNYTSTQLIGHIGNSDGTTYSHYYNGYIDDLRITKGVARYTANFTPPATTFLAQ